MFKTILIALSSGLLLAGCGNLEQDVQPWQAGGFTIGAARADVLQQLQAKNAKILSDSTNVILAELPQQRSMKTELTFEADKLKSITYIPK